MYEKLCINVKLSDVQLLRLHYLYFIYERKIYVVHKLKLSDSWNPPKGKCWVRRGESRQLPRLFY